jgi:hypothetical protein
MKNEIRIQRCPCDKQKKHPEKEKVVHHCNGCACDQLSRLQTQTEVDVFLSGGQVLEDVVFITLDHKNCCVFFNDSTIKHSSTLIVDCQDIQAIRIKGC